MRRREFVTLIGGAAVAWPLAVRAQQPAKVARVGFFRQAGPHDKQFNAFRDGLRAAGYVEGKNVLIEQRYAAGVYERLSGLAVDPVADGLVASFARPGGNLTGLTMTAGYGLAGKRVELLKDMVPVSRVAVLNNPGTPPHVSYLIETRRAATALGLDLRAFDVRGPNDLPGVFAAMADWHADGLVTLADGMFFTQRDR